MAIRIGSSCVKSLAMIMPDDKVIETRRFLIYPTQWYEISRQCIEQKKFLIVTVCIGRNDKLEYMPSTLQWQNIIEDTIVKVISLGGNLNNWRLDIINEPNKYCSKEKYVELVNIAHEQAGGRVKIGAGCDELSYQAFYQYLSTHGIFEVLVIHIQGACQNEAATSTLTNFAKNLANTYKRDIDCNEANYNDVATSSGYEKLKMNLRYAEKIGCANFCMVFENLDQSAFSQDTSKWKFLAFKVNGKTRTNAGNNFNDWINITKQKAPIPNIEEYDEDMKLKQVYQNGMSYETGVRFIQMVLNEDIKPDPLLKVDGWWGPLTNPIVLQYQAKYNLNSYSGEVGPNTYQHMIKTYPAIWDRFNYLYMIGAIK